jgi:hypothetical protein
MILYLPVMIIHLSHTMLTSACLSPVGIVKNVYNIIQIIGEGINWANRIVM